MPNINDAIKMLTNAGKADARGEFEAARDMYIAAKKSLEALPASPARDMSLITCLLHLAAAEVVLDSSRSPMPLVEDALRLAQSAGRTLLAGRGLTILAGRQVRAGLFQAARETLALSNELLSTADNEDALQGVAWNLVLEAQMCLLEGDAGEALNFAERAVGMVDDEEAPARRAADEVSQQAAQAMLRRSAGNGNGQSSV